MYKENSTFAQLLQLVDRLGFDNSVKKTSSDKRYRNFTTRTQLAAMIFAQLTKQTGLQSLENSFKAESDLYHAGIKGNISRATLSYANNHRDSKVFEDFYFRLLDYYKKLVDPSLMKSEGKNLKLIDATVIPLCKNLCEWAEFRSTKSGIKVHVRYDYDESCPDYLFMTNANKHENSTLADMKLCENDIAVFDRGYFNSLQFNKFCETDIQFVTRIKSNVSYSVCDVFGTDGMETNKFIILKDKLIYFSKGKAAKNCSKTLRLVISQDKENGETITLLTNIMNRNALDIAKIYKKRWTIELFFKCIKQNLRIKKFYGLSEKAVKTQIWIALIVYMLFLILKAEYRDNRRTFSNFCSEIGVRLFKHEKLQSWFCFKYSEKSKPEKSTFLEFDFG